MTNQKSPLYIGFDVGSTTVKAVVINIDEDKILWSDYQRHDTKQPEKSLELLKAIEAAVGKAELEGARIFITGSGGSNIGRFLGAKFVQEVNAVSLAVEKFYPQTLSVLTRGHTLRPEVLLLGGPNCYIKGMKDCWRYNIPKMWDERNVPYDKNEPIENLIRVPDNAQYFAAIGAIEYGKEEEPEIGIYKGYGDLEYYINVGREEEKKKLLKVGGGGGLYKDEADLAAFKESYKIPKFTPAQFKPGEVVRGFIGLDGGSTSTKAALISEDKQVLVKSYQLSKGNPIEDTVDILQSI